MKKVISFIIAIITLGPVLGGCAEHKKQNETSNSYVDYHLVEMGKYARIVKVNHPRYTHRVYFLNEYKSWPKSEHLVGPGSNLDFIQELVFAGRDRSNTYWFIKKGPERDTLLYHPWFNTTIEFQSGMFPARLLFDKEEVEINSLFNSDTGTFNELFYGFFLDFYHGHIYLRPLGNLTVLEIDRKGKL